MGMVDENHTIIGGVIDDMNMIDKCPPDAICSYGMHGGLTLFVLFVFFLGILTGWAMASVVMKENKEKTKNGV